MCRQSSRPREGHDYTLDPDENRAASRHMTEVALLKSKEETSVQAWMMAFGSSKHDVY
jgi:hypothetical protein